MLSRILAFVPVLALVSGCGSASESIGGSSQTLPTPVPIFHSAASSQTEHDLGIAEWRIYRGVHETILTGYDASGHARKGIALGAYADTKTTHAHFRARILDGSRVVVRPVFGAASATEGSVTQEQWLLLNDAFHDLDGVISSLAKSKEASSVVNSCTAGVVASTYSGIACGLSASAGGYHAESIASCVVSAKLASDVASAGCMKTLSDNASAEKPAAPESGNSSSASNALANEAFGTPTTVPNASQGASSDVLPPLSIINSPSQQEGAESTQEQTSAPEQSIDQSKQDAPAGSSESDVNNAAADATCASCTGESQNATSPGDDPQSPNSERSQYENQQSNANLPASNQQDTTSSAQSQPDQADQSNPGADPDVSASSSDGSTSMSNEGASGGDDSGFSDGGGGDDSGGGDDGD